ncbi:FxsA family protein [Kytococcus sp. Marseille-QA3725]
MTPWSRRIGTHQRRRRRRGKPTWLVVLSLLLLLMPMLEVAVILAVGRQIGAWWTIGLLIFWSTLGAWLVTREGSRTWKLLKRSLATGNELSRQLTDAALVLVGGTLLLAPGFVTDAMGLFLVVPFTRPITRRVLQRVVEKKLLGGLLIGGDPFGEQAMGFGSPGFGARDHGSAPAGHARGTTTGAAPSGTTSTTDNGDDAVLEGEVIDPRGGPWR